MTTDELKQLILADPTAKDLAERGADDRCAERCREIAPPVPVEFRITELTVLSLYADPEQGERVMGKIETAANTSAAVRRILKWMQPGAPGVDAGDARVRALLTADPINHGAGLTDAEAKPILDAASAPPQISGKDVSACGLFQGAAA